ncbi:phage replication initiation protein, NGO0469 family [Luteimonas saliphila]|uniref:phage replication initiation protein, NGO0469 family n=1 Tax=Luteimonas saliphila TaxID=2804919 RepID=UPI00192D9238|nr:hypothetical protein [Luteimonas saliphila]
MALTLPVGGSGGGDFKRAPAGSHIAVCNLVADCGLQPGSQAFPAPKRKIYVRFEIPAERVEYEKDGKQVEGPLTIGSFYTASMNEKATLRKHLEGWRGKAFTDDEAAAFDVSALLGKAAMLSVIESESGGKTYSNIAGIGKMPKGMDPPEAENPLLYFDDSCGSKELEALPKWLREKIEGQLRPSKPGGSESHAGSDDFRDDDIPF